MDTLIEDQFYSALFVAAGAIIFVLEIFIPSYGILGLFAAGFAGLGIYGFFHQGREALAFGALVVLVAFMVLVLRYVVRRLKLSGTLPPETSISVDEELPSFDGKQGIAVTPLRPAGIAKIDGKRVDVVTSGKFIDQDKRVQVVETSGNRVVVREIPAQ